jgi:hypothetical protein
MARFLQGESSMIKLINFLSVATMMISVGATASYIGYLFWRFFQ